MLRRRLQVHSHHRHDAVRADRGGVRGVGVVVGRDSGADAAWTGLLSGRWFSHVRP